MNKGEEYLQRYKLAKEISAEFYADEMVELADNCENTNKARLQIETRKWIASKLKPRIFGDNSALAVVGDDTRPIRVLVQTHIEKQAIEAKKVISKQIEG